MAKKLQIIGGKVFQSDWNVDDEDNVAYIRNKPNLSEVVKIKNIILEASLWSEEAPYSHPIYLEVTPNNKIDMQPNIDAMAFLSVENIKILIKNDNGIVTAYAINGKPAVDLSLQVAITEVTKENELDVIWGNII